MNNTTTVTVPTWLVNVAHAIANNWVLVGAAILSAFVVSAIVEWVKHRYTVKKAEALGQKALHEILLLVSALFAGLQYYLPFLQQHLRTLETLPYIGIYAVGIYAAANFVYALRLKTWFTTFVTWASKEDKAATAKLANLPELQPPEPSSDESAANFQA